MAHGIPTAYSVVLAVNDQGGDMADTYLGSLEHVWAGAVGFTQG
jgi:hypothetical protein